MKIPSKLSNLTAPFDLVVFPSMGLFYDNKKTYALVRYLTGIEENILTAPMLSEYGLAMDMALNSVLLDDDIELDNLLVCDKNAIILFLRATSFGSTFEVNILCPKCNQSGKTSFDISQMTIKEIYTLPDEYGQFTYVLPKMKIQNEPVVIKFRPMTYADEKSIKELDKTFQQYNKGRSELLTLRYNNQIVSINGLNDKEKIKSIINKIPIKDSLSLRSYMDRVEPGINTTVNLKCNNCHGVLQENFEINNNFLGLTPEYKNVIWEESFLLWYYSNGGVDRDATFTISTAERKWSIQRIEEEMHKKNEAEKKAQGSSEMGSK